VLWDEAMARNLNEFMEKNPGRQVVVLAGSGHMAFGSGIPKRAYRLNNKEYAVILNSDDVRQEIADFVLFPESVAYDESPKLMVILKEEHRRVEITGFAPDSIAGRAGLIEGDIILSLDGEKIAAIEDIKIHLLYKKKGDAVVVKVLRKRFLFGDREVEVRVEF
jgi:membrane-associated protease RseP (regulator of RpoE activity)